MTHLQAIDLPYSSDKDRIAVFLQKREGKEVNLLSLVSVFSSISWAFVLGVMILTLLLMIIFFQTPIARAVSEVGSMMIQVSPDPMAKGIAHKSLIMTLWLFSFLIFAHYTAEVTTYLTVNTQSVPIVNYVDLATDFRYQPITLGSSAMFSLLQNAKPGSNFKTLYDARFHEKPEALVPDTGTALERMLDDPYTALLWMEVGNFPGCVRMPLDFYVQTPVGFGLQKDSELSKSFAFYTLKMQESGIMERMRRGLDKKETENDGPVALTLGFKE